MRTTITPALLILTILTILTTVAPIAARAQAVADYDSTALRIRYSLFGSQLVRGAADEKLASISLFAGDIPVLSSGPEDVAEPFRSFKHKKNLAGAFFLASTAAIVTAFVIGDDDRDSGWLALGTGAVFLLAGSALETAATEDLSRSVWHYNRQLAVPDR